jgi:uncharacterized phage-associated protein
LAKDKTTGALGSIGRVGAKRSAIAFLFFSYKIYFNFTNLIINFATRINELNASFLFIYSNQYMKEYNLKQQKAINSLLYVINKLDKADTHKTYKILYFADQKHLVRYGRPIIGDTYVKMPYGPVPSFIKDVVDENIRGLEEVTAKYNKYFLTAIQELNIDYLSETDIECLDEAIKENNNLSFDELTEKSHDYAYEKSNWVIGYADIAKATNHNEKIINYINNQIINENIDLL